MDCFISSNSIESRTLKPNNLVVKLNRGKRFNRNLNRISIWIGPSLFLVNYSLQQ